MNQTITLTPVILDAIEMVRTQTIAAVTTAKLADGLAISLRQNINKAIDQAIDSVCPPSTVTPPPTDNGDYPSA
jgi:hypothetical protein